MLGIYVTVEASRLELLRLKQEFSSVLVDALGISVCLIYARYREGNAFFKCDDGWLLFDGMVFHDNAEIGAKDLFTLLNDEGPNVISSFNGEFFIASFINGRLEFITDRMGQRQHCVVETQSGVSIAPSPGMAVKLAGREKVINKSALYYFISSKKARLDRSTIWQGCTLLENGCRYTITSDGRLVSNIYWEFEFNPVDKASYQGELLEIYRSAVRLRSSNRYDKGLTLTGGLDSRTMICAIDEEDLAGVTAVTSGMPGCTEVEYASKVANFLGVQHKPYALDADAIFSYESLAYFEEEDIDLVIQGQWNLFCNSMNYDYLLHGLDLDVTIGGIYLTDGLFDVKSRKELVDYIKRDAFFSDDELSSMFLHHVQQEYHDLIEKNISSLLDSCPQSRPQEQYDYFIMMQSMNRVILQRYRAIRASIDTISPMYDVDLLDYYATIPVEERRNYRLFHPFMISLCGDAAQIPYQRTSLPAATPVKFWTESQAIEKMREELYRRIAKETNGRNFIHYNGYYTNVDEWLRFNPTWRSALFELLESKDSLITKEWVQRDYVKKLIEEHQGHAKNNMSVLIRLMSAEIFLRIEQKVSLQELSYKINSGVTGKSDSAAFEPH